MSEYTEQEIAEWFFGQIEWIARKQTSTNLAACEYFDMTFEERRDFFNEVVGPEHEVAGSPGMLTDEGVDFCRNFWNSRDPRLIEGAGLHDPKLELLEDALQAAHDRFWGPRP